MNVNPKVIFEVGTGAVESTKCLKYFCSDIKCILFDPIKKFTDDLSIIAIKNNCKNVVIHNCAIGDHNGEVEIYDHLEATSIVGIQNPSFQVGNKEGYLNSPYNKGIIKVPCFTIDKFDEGNIDILYIDTEGSEWFCIKHLISRPKIIHVEMYMNNKKYVNPFEKEILEWMNVNNYKLIDIEYDANCIFMKND